MFNLAGSYFQYVSLKKDKKSMSAFVHEGYGQEPVKGISTLECTDDPIKFFSDSYSYFVAVADSDVYFSIVYWN